MLIYCDTNTLWNNIKRHDEPKTQRELDALQRLLDLRRASKIQMVRSRVALRELERTNQSEQMIRLRADYEALDPVPMDEKVHGFHSQFDERGGGAYPVVSDVQDEALRDELVQRGLVKINKGREDRSDAEHITQAVANACDVFLTRDENTIIRPHRPWLESRFPQLKIRLPSELASELHF
jgi:hypothetical protein